MMLTRCDSSLCVPLAELQSSGAISQGQLAC